MNTLGNDSDKVPGNWTPMNALPPLDFSTGSTAGLWHWVNLEGKP